jgi:hypothetical protein
VRVRALQRVGIDDGHQRLDAAILQGTRQRLWDRLSESLVDEPRCQKCRRGPSSHLHEAFSCSLVADDQLLQARGCRGPEVVPVACIADRPLSCRAR